METATHVVGIQAFIAVSAITDLTPDWHPSPNFGPRRDGATPRLIVVHYTAMKDCQAALRTLCNPENEVSAHYLIDTSGQVFQMVQEEDRAWHAGAGRWGDICDVNSSSIGIELSNCGFSPFAARQMNALELLLSGIMTRWNIPPEGIIGHSDMAPGRKIDPGARFDWQRLARQDLAVWPKPGKPAGKAQFCADLAAFGYRTDVEFDGLLDAFRLRFRPSARGRDLDAEDQALAAGLTSHPSLA